MRRLMSALAVISLIAATSSIGLAKTKCTGTITGTVNGGLEVSSGTCTLQGATITGGITMSGGQLKACDSTINGAVKITGGDCVSFGLASDDGQGTTCPGDTLNGHVDVSGVESAVVCPQGSTDKVEFEGSTLNGGADVNDNGLVEFEDD